MASCWPPWRGKRSPGLGAMAGNILGAKSTGALFVDLLRSRTVQDHIVDRFNLQHVYWTRYKQDARKTLDAHTDVTEDRKSGVISMTVTEGSPQRARNVAQGYVEELDRLVSQVSTSSARRERMFIEQRLTTVNADLEDAEKQFSAFASKNAALDIKEQTRAMVESAAVLQGQMIAAQSELQSLATDLYRQQRSGSSAAGASRRTQAAIATIGRHRCVPAFPMQPLRLNSIPRSASCRYWACSGPTSTGG